MSKLRRCDVEIKSQAHDTEVRESRWMEVERNQMDAGTRCKEPRG